jgi:hypothetical protein
MQEIAVRSLRLVCYGCKTLEARLCSNKILFINALSNMSFPLVTSKLWSIMCIYIWSRIGVCVTNNNVFWVKKSDLLAPPSQLKSIITAHSQLLPQTRSIPYWTTSVLSFTWLTWLWFTCRSLLQLPLPAGLYSIAEHSTSELPFKVSYKRISWIHEWTLFYNFGRNE